MIYLKALWFGFQMARRLPFRKAVIYVYLLPSILDWRRSRNSALDKILDGARKEAGYKDKDRIKSNFIALINVYLGWTVIGWIVALVLALDGHFWRQGPPLTWRNFRE